MSEVNKRKAGEGQVVVLTAKKMKPEVQKLNKRFWKATMAALKQLAVDCGTEVVKATHKKTKEEKWYVVIKDMKHTLKGVPVDSQHTRTVTLYSFAERSNAGPEEFYWEFEISDDEVKEPEISDDEVKRSNHFYSVFHMRWIEAASKIGVNFRRHSAIRLTDFKPDASSPSRGTYRVNDGTSYQGESVVLFDDMLKLIGKLATMRVYARPVERRA